MSESACERGYSISGRVTEGRPSVGAAKAASLAHLYWSRQCFDVQRPTDNLRLQRKRKRLQDDAPEVVSSDEEPEFAVNAVVAAMEESLDVAVSDDGGQASPHEAIADLALPFIKILFDNISVDPEAPLFGAQAVGPVLAELRTAVVCQKAMKNKIFPPLVKILKRYQAEHADVAVRMATGQVLEAWKVIWRESASVHSYAEDVLKSSS